MKVNIKKTHQNAKMPIYATDGAGCFDLFAASQEDLNTYDTGLAFDIPEGHVMLVFSRSSVGFKYNATLANSVGVIDSDYTGSVKVKFNRSVPYVVGDRIAQAMIIPYNRVSFQFVDDLNETKRGEGAFGSTWNK